MLPTIKYGETVAVSCDGCEKGLTAKVSFIARSAEYTPPVIYSLDERAKLVFLIEARPDAAGEIPRRPAGDRHVAERGAEMSAQNARNGDTTSSSTSMT